jgi:hypothetical protein
MANLNSWLSAPRTTQAVAWLEDGALMAAMLSADLMGQVMGLLGIKYDGIQDFGLSTDGQFLAITDGGAAHVVHHDAHLAGILLFHYTYPSFTK